MSSVAVSVLGRRSRATVKDITAGRNGDDGESDEETEADAAQTSDASKRRRRDIIAVPPLPRSAAPIASSSSSSSSSSFSASKTLTSSFFGRVAQTVRSVVKSIRTVAPSLPAFSVPDWKPTRHTLKAGPSGSCWLLLSKTLPLDLRVSETLFATLWALRPTELGVVCMFGKEVKTPRWTQAYGESYTFSRKKHLALPLSTHPFFEHVQRRVSEISGCPYTQMLVNWYEDGRHRIGWHADDEGTLANPSWDPTAAIGVWSFSYGATRHFDLRPKRVGGATNEPKTELRWAAANNTCIGMFGLTQKHYKHQVPTQTTVRGSRINITLRVFGAPFVAYLRDLELHLQTHLTSTLFGDAHAEKAMRENVMSYVTAPVNSMRVVRH